MRRAVFRSLALALAVAAPQVSAAAVPKVSAGPDLVAQAQAVEAPISKVTVFSDRARVARRGVAKVGAGVHAVRLPDLPGGVMLDTVRVDAKGAKVLRVEATPVTRPRAAIGQVEDLLTQLEALNKQLARHDAKREVYLAERQFLDSISPSALSAEGKRARTPAVDPGAWGKVRGFLRTRRVGISAELRRLDIEREALVERASTLKMELARYDHRAFSKRRTVQVLVVLQARRANPTLSLEYFVPGASWRPAYKVELASGGRALTVRTAGQVNQATGEDWDGVELALSTAIPGQGIAAPELLTWTLGEAKDFTPQPRPEQARPPGTLAPPQARSTLAERTHEASVKALRRRILLAMQGAPTSASAVGADAETDMALDRRLSRNSASRGRPPRRPKMKRKRRRQVRSRAPAPAMSEPAMAELTMESVAMDDAPSGGLLFGAVPNAGARTSLDLFEPPSPQRRRFNDPTLPAAIAGGLDYVYRSQTKVTVPSSPEQHTVPLSSESHPVSTYYEASPGLQPTAYLKAKVKNRGELPILGGPVDIFSATTFVGSGTLETTGVGGDLELPLGADEDLEIVRRVIPKTETEGVFSKDELTRYRTEIEVANRKRRAVKVRLIEQYPITDVEELKIDKRNVTPKPISGPDERGIMTFELDIPAGKKKSVVIEYRIKRPEHWRLWQQ